MTDWHNPILQAAEGLALIKVAHVLGGAYFWEFVLNFDYEYSIITGKRKFNRTVPFYLTCRWSTLLAMITHLVDLDKSGVISCEAQVIVLFVFSYFACQSASCLIIRRVYALWERKRIVAVVAFAIWLADTTAYVYVVAITRVHRIGAVCEIENIVDIRITFITSYTAELVLLTLMLFGVLRWKAARQRDGIWRLMYTQGLVYVAVSTLSCTPSVAFLVLNLNEPMDQMFMFPSMIIMSICALRMYRGLVDSAALNGPL